MSDPARVSRVRESLQRREEGFSGLASHRTLWLWRADQHLLVQMATSAYSYAIKNKTVRFARTGRASRKIRFIKVFPSLFHSDEKQTGKTQMTYLKLLSQFRIPTRRNSLPTSAVGFGLLKYGGSRQCLCTRSEGPELKDFMEYLDALKDYEKSGVPKSAGTDSDEGFDLGRMRRLMELLGNPQSKFKVWIKVFLPLSLFLFFIYLKKMHICHSEIVGKCKGNLLPIFCCIGY